MKILALDTSSKICSVAILENDTVLAEKNQDNGKTHSENLMPMVAEILAENQLNVSDIQLISCCVGPGSFTGIRIGIASTKAMAEVCQIPVAGITSLETLARLDESEKTKVVLLDARNNQVYSGIFDENYQAKQEFWAGDIDELIGFVKSYENLVFIGDGALLHREKIVRQIPDAKFSAQNEQKAGFGGKIAYHAYCQNRLQTADSLQPIYLRKSQAERMKKKE